MKTKKKKVKAIARELTLLTIQMCSTLETQKQKHAAFNQAQAIINKKYGRGWRGVDVHGFYYNGRTSDMFPSIYDEHEHGEHWMD